MRSIEICVKHVQFEGRGIQRLKYCILADFISRNGLEMETYGISVKNLDSGDEERIRDITPIRAEIERISDLIASNTVTPGFLKDALEDMLGVLV